jgi:hypothetical protein
MTPFARKGGDREIGETSGFTRIASKNDMIDSVPMAIHAGQTGSEVYIFNDCLFPVSNYKGIRSRVTEITTFGGNVAENVKKDSFFGIEHIGKIRYFGRDYFGIGRGFRHFEIVSIRHVLGVTGNGSE